MKLETIISCRTDIYFDYQLIDAATGKILVDRVYDKAYEKSNKEEWEEYYQFEQYKHWAVKKWVIAEGKVVFYRYCRVNGLGSLKERSSLALRKI